MPFQVLGIFGSRFGFLKKNLKRERRGFLNGILMGLFEDRDLISGFWFSFHFDYYFIWKDLGWHIRQSRGIGLLGKQDIALLR